MNHYRIHRVSNDCFKSYQSNRKHYVSINGFDSGLTTINCGVPQGSVLGPLLFLLYINDLNQTIKFCKVHHFADDTNLLCLSNSIKKLNKLVNADLKHLVNWLNANKISLNVKKTEMVIFKSKQKKLEGDLKIKLCGKRLYPTESVKYWGVKIDTNLKSYCCLVWAQNFSTIQRILILQKRLLELLISNQLISMPVPYSSKTPA